MYMDLAPRVSQWLYSLSMDHLFIGTPTTDVTLKIAIGSEHGDTVPGSAILAVFHQNLLHTSSGQVILAC